MEVADFLENGSWQKWKVEREPQGDGIRVLDGIRRVRTVQLEILKIQVQQQATLADIEKAIGSDL